MSSKDSIIYEEICAEDLHVIKPLWEKLNRHHQNKSHYFKDYYRKLNYEERVSRIAKRAKGGAVHILTAKSTQTGDYAGYCISVVDSAGTGEVESIYVEESYRGSRLGEELMKDALSWFEAMDTKEEKLVVAEGNEEVFGFYSKFGFFHKSSVLVRKG